MEKHQPVTILLVEDDPGHALLIEKNLRRSGFANDILTLDNGQKAVDFLLKQGDYHEDLDGYQVLKIIKNDAHTRQIPVVVLTTTDTPHEVARCYELGCNVYVAKPVDYGQFSEAIRNLGLFLSIVKIPD
jgi:CheY-like chemotaxis protein